MAISDRASCTRIALWICLMTVALPIAARAADGSLAEAAARADVAVVRQLLSSGADVNAADNAADNALDAAGNAVDDAGNAVENAGDAVENAAENAG